MLGVLDKESGDIGICAPNCANAEGTGKFDRCSMIYEVMRHELIHLAIRCGAVESAIPMPEDKCQACLCDEANAAMGSGECNEGSVYYRVNGFKSFEECVKLSAARACEGACPLANMSDEQKIAWLDKHWDWGKCPSYVAPPDNWPPKVEK